MRWSSIPLLLLLCACATNIPDAIREPPPNNPTVEEVRHNMESYIGQRVRWGGTIAGVENGKTETRLEVVARDLDGNGRPRATDRSPGRFLARVEGFLDPAVYSNGREVTVVGTLAAPETRRIGEYTYRYPVVKADMVHLWEPREEPRQYRDPYYYDPFWRPWGPWGPFSPWHSPFYPGPRW